MTTTLDTPDILNAAADLLEQYAEYQTELAYTFYSFGRLHK